MTDKKFKGAPFGTQTARFDVAGVHPKSKAPGTFTEMAYCKKALSATSRELGPGKYEIDGGCFSASAVEQRASGPGWARAYEVARMAALPHLLHKEQWQLKRMLQRKLGPGSYEIKDFLDATAEKPRSTRGIIQTRDTRFKAATENDCFPGPGTYGKDGIPAKALEEKQQQSFSTVGMLDASTTGRTLPQVGSHLGPGTYNFESSTDQLAKRVVSLRGPYDLFTGDKNKPLKTGHYVTVNNPHLGPGKYEINSFTDELATEHTKKKGEFSKRDQYPNQHTERLYNTILSQCPRKAGEPGPGQYDPNDPNVKPPSQAKKSPGFLSSAQRSDKMATKFFTGNFNPVGAGRYDVQKFEEAKHRNGHTSVFKSKSNRPGHTKQKFLQERIRAKDLRFEDRVYLVEPEHPNEHLRRYKSFMHQNLIHPELSAHKSATVVY